MRQFTFIILFMLVSSLLLASPLLAADSSSIQAQVSQQAPVAPDIDKVVEKKEVSLFIKCVFEAVGTFILILLGCGVVACVLLPNHLGNYIRNHKCPGELACNSQTDTQCWIKMRAAVWPRNKNTTHYRKPPGKGNGNPASSSPF